MIPAITVGAIVLLGLAAIFYLHRPIRCPKCRTPDDDQNPVRIRRYCRHCGESWEQTP